MSSKLIRRLLSATALIAVGVPTAGYILLNNMDINSFKPQIEKMAFEQLGRKLTIAGEIRIQPSLTPTLSVENITLENAPWAGTAPLAKVGKASVKVDLRPLLNKQLVINEVVLDGIEAQLATTAKGENNWTLAPAKPQETTPATTSSTTNAPPLALQISALDLTNSRLTFMDGQSKREITVDMPNTTLRSEDGFHSTAVQLKDLRLHVNEPQPKRTISAVIPLTTAQLDASFFPTQLALKDTSVTLKDASKKQDLSVSLPATELTLGSSVTAKTSAHMAGIDSTLTLQAPDLETMKQGTMQLELMVKAAESAQLTAKGKLENAAIDPRFDLTVDGNATSLKAFEALASTTLPAIEPATVHTTISGTPTKLNLADLKGNYGATNFSGKSSVDLSGKVPAITATLHIPTLGTATDTAQSDSSSTAASSQSTSSGRLIPDVPLTMPQLTQVNALVNLSVDEIKGKTPIKELATNAQLSGGALELKPLRFTLRGTPVETSLKLTPQGGATRIEMHSTANTSNVGTFLKDLQVNDRVEGGKAQVALQFSGSGTSVHNLLPTLQGNISFLMQDGVYHGGSGLQNATNFLQAVTGKGQSSDISLSCLATDMPINGGVLKPRWLVFKTNNARVDGEGTIDLTREALALRFYPRSEKQGLGQITLPINVKGSFSNPSVTPDAQGSVAMIAKAALDLKGQGSTVNSLSSSISQRFDISAQTSPCVTPAPASSTQDTAQALKDLAKTSKEDVKQQIKDVKQNVKDIKEELKNIKNDPAALQNTLQGLQKLF